MSNIEEDTNTAGFSKLSNHVNRMEHAWCITRIHNKVKKQKLWCLCEKMRRYLSFILTDWQVLCVRGDCDTLCHVCSELQSAVIGFLVTPVPRRQRASHVTSVQSNALFGLQVRRGKKRNPLKWRHSLWQATYPDTHRFVDLTLWLQIKIYATTLSTPLEQIKSTCKPTCVES